MKHISKFLLIITIIVWCGKLNAQQTFKGEPLKLDPATSRFVHPASVKGWIQLRQDAPYVASLIFEEAPQLLGMHAGDEMRIFKMNVDAAGNRHYKYAQYYKDIRVEGIEQIVHEKNNRVYHINGDFISDLNLDVLPSITAEQAIQTAIHAAPAQRYLWEDEKNQLWFQYKKHDPEASLYPEPELLIVKREAKDKKVSSSYVLAWRMIVHTQIPRSSMIVYVNAQTGEVLKKRNAEKMCDPPLIPIVSCATVFNTWQLYCAATSHYGTQLIALHNENCDDENTRSDDGCYNDSEVWSRDYNTGDAYCGLEDTYYGGTPSEIMGASAIYTTRQVMISFIVTFDHEGFSGTGDIIDVFNDATFYNGAGGPYYTNSSFDPTLDNIYLGRGATSSSSTDDFNTIDIVAHEFTHGIINDAHFDDLDDDGEAGAVNEALCDFFGETCGELDWLVAGEKSDGAIRSFSNPNSYNDPDTYQGSYWYSGSGDNGGVHTNCGVMDYCMYLMSEGGSGTNDLGYHYDVTALPGIYSTSLIAWQAMMNYIDGSDDFEIVRNCFIQAATDLYGSCSDEVLTVCEAFNAVGISHYTSFNLASMCGTYSSPTPYTIDAVEGVSNASVSNYNFSTACTSTVTSTGNVIAESGSYVQLNPGFTATSGCTFTAQIEPCSITDYDPDNLRQPFYPAPEHNSSQEEQLLNPFMSIYPNPSDESFIVEFTPESKTPMSIYVMDVTGRTVMHLKENEIPGEGKQKLEVNTSALMPSAYLLVMKSSGKTHTSKFIVQH